MTAQSVRIDDGRLLCSTTPERLDLGVVHVPYFLVETGDDFNIVICGIDKIATALKISIAELTKAI